MLWLMAVAPSTSLADYGPLGLVVLASFSAIGWLARTFIKRGQEREDRLEKELREANQLTLSILTDKALPTLLKVADLLDKVHDVMERLLEAERRDR